MFVDIDMNASKLCLYLSNTVRWKHGRSMPFYAQSTMRGNIRAIYVYDSLQCNARQRKAT